MKAIPQKGFMNLSPNYSPTPLKGGLTNHRWSKIWIGNYIPEFYVDVINNPCSEASVGLNIFVGESDPWYGSIDC